MNSRHPYQAFPDRQFWRKGVLEKEISDIDFDAGKKFDLPPESKFATAGSCFAQHFARILEKKGGRLIRTENAHPLHSPEEAQTYTTYSARYGNLYTNRQLLELVQQALGVRPVIEEFVECEDRRFRDALRPGVSSQGFSSINEIRADRHYHLKCVKKMLQEMNVMVFTMGLTEAWINLEQSFVYPVCPGTIIGEFNRNKHEFRNFSLNQCIDDLRQVVLLIQTINPKCKILLTVSPVGLVATAENRSIVVSSTISKSTLRICAEALVEEFDHLDYFPSFEIVTGPQSQGKLWCDDLREVTAEGVEKVMHIFFNSRMRELHSVSSETENHTSPSKSDANLEESIQHLIDAECEELFLDKK